MEVSGTPTLSALLGKRPGSAVRRSIGRGGGSTSRVHSVSPESAWSRNPALCARPEALLHSN